MATCDVGGWAGANFYGRRARGLVRITQGMDVLSRPFSYSLYPQTRQNRPPPYSSSRSRLSPPLHSTSTYQRRLPSPVTRERVMAYSRCRHRCYHFTAYHRICSYKTPPQRPAALPTITIGLHTSPQARA